MTEQVPSISIEAVLRGGARLGLELELIAGAEGLSRLVTIPHVQKVGLAFAGFDDYLSEGRVLVLGPSEIRYLESLDPQSRRAVARRATSRDLPCLLVTSGLAAPDELIQAANEAALPVLATRVITPTAIARITTWLEDRLAVRETVHGVLIDILGLGVLIIGDSGVGKSECALDLVVRGHRLVADDAVEIRRRAESVVIGSCADLTRHCIEIRGLGIIDVEELFGVASVRSSKRVELVVRLERWEQGKEYERLGLDPETHELLGCHVPMVRIPVAPGRNLATLTEVAARMHLMQAGGRHAARDLAFRLDQRLRELADESADESADELEDGEPA